MRRKLGGSILSMKSPLSNILLIVRQDIQAHHTGEMAVFTSDTLEHDMARISSLHNKQEQVSVFNLCTDTTRNMNGVVTNMHPAEGVWLFR